MSKKQYTIVESYSSEEHLKQSSNQQNSVEIDFDALCVESKSVLNSCKTDTDIPVSDQILNQPILNNESVISSNRMAHNANLDMNMDYEQGQFNFVFVSMNIIHSIK